MAGHTQAVKVGGLVIGGGAPIVVQSMTTTKTQDIIATVKQIKELEGAGCEIVRLAVPDRASIEALDSIREQARVPIVADVHFKPSLALAALDQSIDKLRLNPGTIRDLGKVKEIVLKAKDRNIPIRIGINSGSLHPKFRDASGGLARALVDSALEYVELFEDLHFDKIVISVKSSSVVETVESYRMLAKTTRYPLHVGITEAGTLLSGSVKSAVGLGILLFGGIGDTMRVSLAAHPVDEVKVAYKILGALGLRNRGPDVIACPTCGRSEIDLVPLVEEVEQRLCGLSKHVRIAVMGCEVNGPGEAKEADIGIAGGKTRGLLFKRGKIIKKLPAEGLTEALIEETERLILESKKS